VEFVDGRERLPGEAVDGVPHRLSLVAALGTVL
jgi:hypothetical protein